MASRRVSEVSIYDEAPILGWQLFPLAREVQTQLQWLGPCEAADVPRNTPFTRTNRQSYRRLSLVQIWPQKGLLVPTNYYGLITYSEIICVNSLVRPDGSSIHLEVKHVYRVAITTNMDRLVI